MIWSGGMAGSPTSPIPATSTPRSWDVRRGREWLELGVVRNPDLDKRADEANAMTNPAEADKRAATGKIYTD